MTTWSLNPIFESYLVVAVAAGVLLALLAVSPNFARIDPRRRWTLVSLRLALIGLVLLAMLRPTRVSSSSRPQTASLLVLIDSSRSMQLPNGSGGRSRWDAQKELLSASASLLAQLSKQFDLKLYSYDAELHRLNSNGSIPQLPDRPEGQQTDLGTTLAEAVGQELGRRLAAVIVLGDGTQTAVEPRVEVYEAARELARQGYPLYTIAFGPSGDAVQARDVAVDGIADHYTVFVKNEISIRASVRVRGYVNQELPLQLLLEDASGGREVAGSRTVTAREDGQLIDVAFPFAPTKPGQYKLTVSVAPQPGELVAQNNRQSAFLTVLDGGLRVLYLEGDPRPEQSFLRQSLDASPDIELDFQWIDARQRERWPVDLATTLAGSKYDAYILGDLDSMALGERGLARLVEEVDQGKGLMMLGGYHSFGPGGYGNTPLADPLPIAMSRLERQNFGESVRNDLHLPGPITILPSRDHSITRLAAGENNAAVWASLPPLPGANKFSGIKDGAGVQVLARGNGSTPLLVSGEYGNGRVLAFAGDSTWRWWLHGRQAEHKKFWRQAVLWLVRREDLTQDDVSLKLERRRYPPGVRVAFQAAARTAAGDVIADASYQATLLTPDGKRIAIQVAREGDHGLGLIDPLTQPGDYTIQLTASREGKELGTARAEFMVVDQDLELSVAAADHDQMTRLALLTQEHGGGPIAPEQLAALLEQLGNRPERFDVEVESKWQLADTPLDAWLVLVIFTSILSIEWFLRKKWGLV